MIREYVNCSKNKCIENSSIISSNFADNIVPFLVEALTEAGQTCPVIVSLDDCAKLYQNFYVFYEHLFTALKSFFQLVWLVFALRADLSCLVLFKSDHEESLE
uniref:Uncharacterized protein n=1 Tax=Glossina brevipalpis TaxID=37001 RepID=A0A1A9WHE4_9MUSC